MTDPGRLVTVGLPVRNGAATLAPALDSLLQQTHRPLRIVISDNASTDGTPGICREFIGRFPDIIAYFRHDVPLTVTQNWAAAYRAARSPYFMWAADDDLRSPDFVERLVAALEAHPEAGLAFGEVVKIADQRHPERGVPHPYRCDTAGIPTLRRLWMDKNGPFAPYGVYRTEVLAGYRWYEHSVSPDWPLIMYLLVRTEIVQVRGTYLYYYAPAAPVPAAVRAERQSFRRIESYPTLRLAWRSAQATRDAARERGERRIFLLDFAVIFLGILWANRRWLLRWALER